MLSPVQFGTNSGGSPLIYSPFPISHSEISQSSKGDLQSFSVSVGNVTREISQVLATYNGLIGQPVVIRLVNASELLNAQAQIREDAKIRGVKVTSQYVTFTLSLYNLYDSKFPPFRVIGTHCRWNYGGIQCGYNLTTPGALVSCSKLLTGNNGCEAHGEAELAAGVEVKHPKRFGAYPGVFKVR